jgi:DNA primase
MPKFPAEFIEELRQAADIVHYIGEHVVLRKEGASWKGRCPFHHDAGPSFAVRARPPMFHCFGCGKAGDVFRFAMLHMRLTFPEAVASVARHTGMAMPQSTVPDMASPARQSVLEVLEAAARHFRSNLGSARGAGVRDYLLSRGLTVATLEAIAAGAAPGAWDDLVSALAPRFGTRALVEAGLAIPPRAPRGRPCDRFRNRAVFPLHDALQRVVAFGARAIDDTVPKYLNSPASPVYQKGRLLYGLPWGVEAARAAGRVVLVEGYLDAAAALQAGVAESLALCGTALTEPQARLLQQTAPRVLLCLDHDPPGTDAARRAMPLLLGESLDTRVVALPAGHDPDSFVRAEGAGAFRDLLDHALPALDWLIRTSAQAHDLATPGGKAAFFAALVPCLARVQDAVERSAWVRVAAIEGGLDEGAAREQLAHAMETPRRPPFGTDSAEFVWASTTGANGTPLVADLERRGWTRVAAHRWYEDTWLLQRLASRS